MKTKPTLNRHWLLRPRSAITSLTLTVVLTTTAQAQATFAYGWVYGSTAGRVVDEVLPNGTILSTGHYRASAEAADNHLVPGLAQAHYVDYNPAGGFYDVELNVPAGKIHSSILSPPKVWVQTATSTLNADGSAYALVRFQDVITITAPTVGYEPWPILTLHGHLDGNLTAGTGGSAVAGTVDFRISLGGAGVFSVSPGAYDVFQQTVTTPGASASYDEDLLARATVQFAGPGSQATVLVEGYLTTTAGNGGSANFQNTASLGLELPPGYTYTAAMGFATAVPEPAHGVLAALGLLGVAVWRHGRGRTPASPAGQP